MVWHHGVAQLFLAALFSTVINAPVFAAEPIEFPEEELARESVLPVFDKKVAVRERLVTTAKRFEFGGGAGLNLIEALYKNLTFNFLASYHFTESSAFTLLGTMASTDLSNMGQDLKNKKGIDVQFDPSLAPAPEYYISGNYQFTAYYGKISITKNKFMNLSMHGLAGLGMVSFGDSMEPLANVGIGQRLYFTPNVGLRFDLHLMIYRGPDPTSRMLNDGIKHGSEEFDKTLYFRSFLAGAFIFMI